MSWNAPNKDDRLFSVKEWLGSGLGCLFVLGLIAAVLGGLAYLARLIQGS